MVIINKEQFGQHQSDIEDLKKRQKLSELVSMGLIVILFLTILGLAFALGTIMVDSYRSSESSYLDLVNKVNEQNYKISDLNKVVNLICKTWRKDCPNQ